MSSNARDRFIPQRFLLRAGQLSQLQVPCACAPCAEKLLVHPEVSHPMRLTELNVVPVLSILNYE